jgi:hypothetical protein
MNHEVTLDLSLKLAETEIINSLSKIFLRVNLARPEVNRISTKS